MLHVRLARMATLLACLSPIPAIAQNFTLNSFSFLLTDHAKTDPVYGYGTPDNDLQVAQFEHFSTHDWGDIYFDAEMYHGDDVGAPLDTGNSTQALFVLNPRLSLGKITHTPLKWGPVSDVSLIGRWEAGSYPSGNHFHSQNYGVSLNFSVPGFAWFESGLLYRHTNFDPRTWLWRSVLMSNPIPIGGQKFNFNFLSMINGSRNNSTEIFTRSDFLWEVGGNPRAQLGLRVEYVTYSNDPTRQGRDFSRFTPFLMAKLTL